jgi:DNA-binding NarL/FixJ family response regulator
MTHSRRQRENGEVMTVSLVVVDHPPAVMQTLIARLSLEPDLCVVGAASDGSAAIELTDLHRPDVVLLDAEMPHLDLRSTARELATRTAVVVLTIEPARARFAIPTATVVGKHEGTGALLAAIRAAGAPS